VAGTRNSSLTVQVCGALQVSTLLFGIDRLNVKADSAAKYHREERDSARHSLLLLLSVRMYIDGRRKNLNKLCCRLSASSRLTCS
jgi:hypothetical protein